MRKILFNRHNLILIIAISILIFLNMIFVKDILTKEYQTAIILSNIGFSIFLISVISISRIFFIPFFIIMLFIGSLLSYFQIFFGINFNESVLESTLNTDYDEAITFVDYKLILWIVVFWLIPSTMILLQAKSLKIRIKNKFISTLLIAFIGASIFYTPMLFVKGINPIVFLQHMTAVNLYPSNLVVTVKTYFKHNKFRNGEKKDVFGKYTFNLEENGIKVVLVIGESARSDRFGINGYSRNTTPKLEEENNLVSFKDAYSLATYTIKGIKNIFKIHSLANENTIISVFNKLDFKSWWVSLQSFVDDINSVASEANELITKEILLQNNNYNIKDENLVSYMHNLLAQNKSSNQFIVLHTQGSHRTYDDRYPEDFRKFAPTCTDANNSSILKRIFQRNSCEYKEESGNSYDNSILYTDYVLSKMINELKPYKAMFIYISDHGESLGENGIYLHSYEYSKAPKEQVHVPYLLWFSDNLLKSDPMIKRNMEIAQSNANKKVDQSTVLYSLLDCINVQSNFIDKRKSVCSKDLGHNVQFGRK